MQEVIEFKVVTPRGRQPQVPSDRGGGEQHGMVEAAGDLVAKTVKTSAEQISKQIGGAITALASAIGTAVADYKIEEVKLSLAVTAEGDIGIVTAGIEGSIEITLKPR